MGIQPSMPRGYYQDEKVGECANDFQKYTQMVTIELRKLFKDKKLSKDSSYTKKIAELLHWLQKTLEYSHYLYKHPENPIQAEEARILKQQVERNFLPALDGSKKFDTLTPSQTLFSAMERYYNGHTNHLMGILDNMTDLKFKANVWLEQWEKFSPYPGKKT